MPETIHKMIITGTGRAGTTFLVRLLTELGLDTGFSAENWQESYDVHCQAGLEHSLTDPDAPYIIKNPALCAELPALLSQQQNIVIDHAIIPIRDLDSATRSRIRIGGTGGAIPGGLWLTDDPAKQKTVLAESFHELIHCLINHEVPLAFLAFPRFATDADYAHRKLHFLLNGHTRDEFTRAFKRVSAPALIHDYKNAIRGEVADPTIAAQYLAQRQRRAALQRQRKFRRRVSRIANALVVIAAGALAVIVSRSFHP